MKIQKVVLLLLCPLLLNACGNKGARLDAVEESLINVEEKMNALLTYTDKTHDALADLDLRLEMLEKDAKKRGVPVRIKGSDIAAAKAELMRLHGRTPMSPPMSTAPYMPAQSTLTSQNLLPQNMSKTQGGKITPQANSSAELTTKMGNNKSQDLQFPAHTELSPSVTPATSAQNIGPITGQNLSQVSQTAVPPTVPPKIQTQPKVVKQTPAKTPSPVQKTKNTKTPSSYDAAMALYKNGKYKEAEQAFDAFLKANPEGVLAPNALYWKGETLYARANYPQAIFAFKEVQTRYPKHAKAPDSLLKTAMSYAKLGDTENANLHYIVLEEDFPTSPAAKRIPK